MKVTLRKFLDIVGNNLIETHICKAYVEVTEKMFPNEPELDDMVDTFNKQIQFNGYEGALTHINQLNPYLDYEIYGFDQRTEYGEVVDQILWLREME